MRLRRIMKRVPRQSGFTLIEVLLVVAILGILAGVVVVNFGGKQEAAMIKACRTSIQGICTAVDMYEVDNGRYPPSLQALISSSGEQNWNGPYIRGGVPVDPWGQPFQFTQSGNTYKVTSPGPPGKGASITSFEF
jgi:general secretion pathway protein G